MAWSQYLHSSVLQSSLNLPRFLFELVLPPQCARCREPTADPGSLCIECWQQMNLIDKPLCDVMGSPMPYDQGEGTLCTEAINHPPDWDRLRGAVLFDDVARYLVHALKYRDRHDVAGVMARMMVRAGKEVFDGADLILPVPLHWRRLWFRRFNQSAILSRKMADLTAVPQRTDVLRRIRATPSQVGLKSADRLRNVKNAFEVPAEHAIEVAGRRLVLIDDVKTTGATLNACAAVLKQAGAVKVDVVVFALVADQV